MKSILLMILFLVPLCSCKSISRNGTPSVLRIAYSPESEQAGGGLPHPDLMRNYLQKQLNMPVELVEIQGGYGLMIEAMRAEKIDVARMGPLQYLLAAQRAGAEAIAALGDKNGGLYGFYSLIAVPKDSPYHSLTDLKAHARQITFAFADPVSASGDLYPRVGFAQVGIDPEKDFKEVVYTGQHLPTIMAIKSGEVDAGAFGSGVLASLMDQRKLAANDIRVIWRSSLVPDMPYVVRAGLPAALNQRIQDALVNLPSRDPQLWATIIGSYPDPPAGDSYIAVNDHTYDNLRHYAAQAKDFKFLEK